MKKFITYYLLIATCILGACSFQTKHRGFIFPDDLESTLATVKTTDALVEKIGSPSAKTIYGDAVWIYYGADENFHGPFPVSYDNKKVLLVWTSGKKILRTAVLTDADLPDVDLADGATPIPAEIRLNAFQELVNNVGRFTPAGLGQ